MRCSAVRALFNRCSKRYRVGLTPRNSAQHNYDPICIVAFNIADGWSRDVTEDIADELRDRCIDLDQTPVYLQEFLKPHPNGDRT